jgi:hypothetical protein
MGKTGKALKRRKLEQQAQLAVVESDNEDEAASDFLGGLVRPQEVAVAAKVLSVRSAHFLVLLRAAR